MTVPSAPPALAVSGGAFMFGQLMTGGLITADVFGWGWRWAFIPFVVAGPLSLLLAARVLPYIEPAGTGRPDLAGAGVLAVVSFLVMFPLIQGRNAGWPLWIVVMLLTAIPVFWAFLRMERRIVTADGDPLIDPSLFRIRTFALGNAITLLFSLIAAAGPLYLILTIQLGFGRNALEAALLTAPMPFANIGGSLIAAPLLRRFGRQTLTIGALCTAASAVAVLIGVTGSATSPLVITPGVALLGAGLGISIAASMAIVLGDVPPQHAGSASGVQGTGMQLASSMGIAVYGLLFYGEVGSNGDLSDYLDGARDTMFLTLVFVALQLLLVPLLPRHRFAQGEEIP
ncbi:MFS transporter, partial [bacterium]|nr:MFS transporter [bacterium]